MRIFFILLFCLSRVENAAAQDHLVKPNAEGTEAPKKQISAGFRGAMERLQAIQNASPKKLLSFSDAKTLKALAELGKYSDLDSFVSCNWNSIPITPYERISGPQESEFQQAMRALFKDIRFDSSWEINEQTINALTLQDRANLAGIGCFYELPPIQRFKEYAVKYKDFEQAIEILKAKQNQIGYTSQTHKYTYKDRELENLAKYSVILLEAFSPRAFERPNSPESKLISREVREALTQDTNTPDMRSRMEPIDILAFQFAQKHFGSDDGDIVKNGRHAKQAIATYFKGDIGAHVFSASIENESGFRGSAYKSIKFLCLGGMLSFVNPSDNELRLRLLNEGVYNENPLFGAHVFSDSVFNKLLKLGYEDIHFRCGDREYSANLASNFLEPVPKAGDKLSTKAVKDRKLKIGDDKKIKSTVTIGLVSEAGVVLETALRASMAANQYAVKQVSRVKDLKSEFTKDFIDSDMYLPVGHSLSVERFTLGSEGGKRFVFEKKIKDGDAVSELVVYLPPGQKNPNDDVETNLSGQEVADALESRYKGGIPPPFILNMSCDSADTARGWVFAHGVATERLGCADTEKPVVVGTDRSFATESVLHIASHLKHPMAALKVAENEGTADDLFRAMKQTGYDPVSNHNAQLSPRSESQIIRVVDRKTGEVLRF